MSAAKISKKKSSDRKDVKKNSPLSGQESDQQLINDLSTIGTAIQKSVRRIEVDSRRR